MLNGRRRRVKRRKPCPACRKCGWCIVALDGGTLIYVRIERGDRARKRAYVSPLTGVDQRRGFRDGLAVTASLRGDGAGRKGVYLRDYRRTLGQTLADAEGSAKP